MEKAKDNELLQAAESGDVAAALAALDNGADLQCKDKNRYLPLHLAAMHGHADVAALLVERGADVNAKGFEDWTPLQTAARNGHVAVAAFLLDHNADVNAKTSDGCTSLYFAAYGGHADLATLLLEHGADVNATIDGFGQLDTPLSVAVLRDHVDVVELLLQRGAATEPSQDVAVPTPLSTALHNSSFDVAFQLLWGGADASRVIGMPEVEDADVAEQSGLAGRWWRYVRAGWFRGELRCWSRDAHAVFPSAFCNDVASVLLATLGSLDFERAEAAWPGLALHDNPLRMLREQHLLEPLFNALLLAHMGGPAAPPRADPGEPTVRDQLHAVVSMQRRMLFHALHTVLPMLLANVHVPDAPTAGEPSMPAGVPPGMSAHDLLLMAAQQVPNALATYDALLAQLGGEPTPPAPPPGSEPQ